MLQITLTEFAFILHTIHTLPAHLARNPSTRILLLPSEKESLYRTPDDEEEEGEVMKKKKRKGYIKASQKCILAYTHRENLSILLKLNTVARIRLANIYKSSFLFGITNDFLFLIDSIIIACVNDIRGVSGI